MPHFASHLNFLDPQTDEDGNAFAPIRYKQIVKECYLISKNLNTSYTDVLNITPTEKQYMLEFLLQEAQENKEAIERLKAERQNKNK
jgi:hypothetical protein